MLLMNYDGLDVKLFGSISELWKLPYLFSQII
jgi:hypothetical protein